MDNEGYSVFKELSDEDLQRYYIQCNKEILASGTFNAACCRFPVPTTWNVERLEVLLEEYHDKEILDFIKYGWPIDLKHVPGNIPIPNNQRGTVANPDELRRYVDKELTQRSIIGPFTSNPFEAQARISPIDAIPKKDASELRIILNLSHPVQGDAINDAVDKDVYLVVPQISIIPLLMTWCIWCYAPAPDVLYSRQTLKNIIDRFIMIRVACTWSVLELTMTNFTGISPFLWVCVLLVI